MATSKQAKRFRKSAFRYLGLGAGAGKFEVMSERCDQCLYGANRIVSKDRFKEIIADIERKDCHFICHKATIQGRDVCCRGDWDARGGGKLGRFALWLNYFVEVRIA